MRIVPLKAKQTADSHIFAFIYDFSKDTYNKLYFKISKQKKDTNTVTSTCQSSDMKTVKWEEGNCQGE